VVKTGIRDEGERETETELLLVDIDLRSTGNLVLVDLAIGLEEIKHVGAREWVRGKRNVSDLRT
jgi:hypothetical protein